jgi:alkylated DNA nucleotide flippase Atl1
MPSYLDPESTDEAVYRVLEEVPAGRVTSYGAVAALLGLSTPRRPAAAMRRAPDGLPWWRMIRADGTLPPSLLARARGHWEREGTPHSALGAQPAARWEPTEEDEARILVRVEELCAAEGDGAQEA